MQDKKPAPQFDDYLPPARKQLYFAIMAGSTQWQFITSRLFFLDEHMPPAKLEPVLKWLIKHKIVGAEFIRFWREKCKASDLEMHRHLIEVIDNEGLNPLIAGKNFKV